MCAIARYGLCSGVRICTYEELLTLLLHVMLCAVGRVITPEVVFPLIALIVNINGCTVSGGHRGRHHLWRPVSRISHVPRLIHIIYIMLYLNFGSYNHFLGFYNNGKGLKRIKANLASCFGATHP